MKTSSAFAMGDANRDREYMIFDWDEAARRIKRSGTLEASAGLRNDWEYTGGDILRKGNPVKEGETYTFLASTWAAPELDLGEGPEKCYLMASETDWDEKTLWPPSALLILNTEEN